ncbi:MAG TPA: lipoyl(octanoyl) transferase LipB [Terriglobia bacterium]|nr:lipoyl(octanoyl) transferase LipB [Terriglobia bacterium]
MLCNLEQLGLVDYASALELQRERVAERKAGAIPDALLLLEHPHVYTLGRNGRQENILVSAEWLASRGAQVVHTDRGGDVTYHGPGQLVGYPILDLTQHRRDISWYMRSLEEVFIRTARDYGIEAGRSEGAAGVWVGNDKLVAMGVHLSRWITSHGFALNVNTDLRYFEWIVPCGLQGKGVTSLARLLGRTVKMEEVAEKVVEHFGAVFGLEVLASRQSKVEGRKSKAIKSRRSKVETDVLRSVICDI